MDERAFAPEKLVAWSQLEGSGGLTPIWEKDRSCPDGVRGRE